MACVVDLKCDALKYSGGTFIPALPQDITFVDLFKMLDQFSIDDLKAMFFLCMTDLHDKESLRKYLELVVNEENYMKYQFSKKWVDKKFSRSDLIELLGTIKKFKYLKNFGICKHTFERQMSTYKTIPEISKFLFSVCEELDDDEVKLIKCHLFPEISEEISAEELICLLLYHEKMSCNDFSCLKQSLSTLGRNDLISRMEDYEHISEEVYPVRQPTLAEQCGLALIINQKNFTECGLDVTGRPSLEERKGSDTDCRNLEKMWQTFGFRVEIHINSTEELISQLLESLSDRNMSCYDVFAMCIMSHGQKGGFYSSDSKVIAIDSFIARIADRCMFGKPKLFFIQACQGDQHNEGIPLNAQPCVRRNLVVDSRPEISTLPRCSDIFKAVATIDNHVSYRDEEQGSLFISYLVKNISKYGDREDIQATLTRVKRKISEQNAVFNNQMYKQQPVSVSTLRKKVILKRVLL